MENKIISKDPSNNEVVGEVNITPVEAIPEIIIKAKKAQKHWKQKTVSERIELIRSGVEKVSEQRLSTVR